MQASLTQSVDNRKLIKILFERQTPASAAPVIEVVFVLDFPDGFNITGNNTLILTWLSTTRTDTREKVNLTKEEQEAVYRLASQKAAETTPDW